MHYDAIIIGGGIVGAATAWQLKLRHPDMRVLLLEKESDAARHQTGHNSGVVHAGVYYAPGSLKARFCREGAAATLEFCREAGIAHEQCGKFIVAANEPELAPMHALLERCRANGVQAEAVSGAELRYREPEIRGAGALFVPQTAIVNFAQICRAYLHRFTMLGGDVSFGTEVRAVREHGTTVRVEARGRHFECGYAVCCAGLMSDRLALHSGLDPEFRIVPIRGEFYRLPAHRRGLIHSLVYPVPDPALPFAGVHITRGIDGTLFVGPNAVPALKREGYGTVNWNVADIAETMAWPGAWRLARRYWRQALSGMRDSWFKQSYVRRLRMYCPALGTGDLLPHPAGVRAQAVRRDGTMVEDFLFMRTPRSLHVCNAPSPAATSALPIAAHLCEMVSAA